MADQVVVMGAGPIGLATAMLLAAQGRSVTVLELDEQGPAPTVEHAFGSWQRPGVAQFRQAHLMHPLFRQLVDAHLPGVRDRLDAAGGRRFSLLPTLLRHMGQDTPKDGDERFEILTARRPVLERAFADEAESTPGVTVRRGVSVTGPLVGPSILPGVPHVTGVRTSAGENIATSLVIDATGRRSTLPTWVTELGGRAPIEEAHDAGFAYYTRHFAPRDGVAWEPRGPLALDAGTLRVLTLPTDNGTWTIAIVAVSGDKPFKALRHNHVWERVARAVPTAGALVDGQPLCDVLPMAGVLDRYRRFVVDDVPVVTGVVAVGDAWACTNPTAGRGMSLGLAHAVALRDALSAHPDDPVKLARAFDEVTEQTLTPWYRDQVERDQQRAAVFRATISGEPAPPPVRDPLLMLQAAARTDAEALRGFLDAFSCLALPERVLSRPGMGERVQAAMQDPPPPPFAVPSREELLALAAE